MTDSSLIIGHKADEEKVERKTMQPGSTLYVEHYYKSDIVSFDPRTNTYEVHVPILTMIEQYRACAEQKWIPGMGPQYLQVKNNATYILDCERPNYGLSRAYDKTKIVRIEIESMARSSLCMAIVSKKSVLNEIQYNGINFHKLAGKRRRGIYRHKRLCGEIEKILVGILQNYLKINPKPDHFKGIKERLNGKPRRRKPYSGYFLFELHSMSESGRIATEKFIQETHPLISTVKTDLAQTPLFIQFSLAIMYRNVRRYDAYLSWCLKVLDADPQNALPVVFFNQAIPNMIVKRFDTTYYSCEYMVRDSNICALGTVDNCKTFSPAPGFVLAKSKDSHQWNLFPIADKKGRAVKTEDYIAWAQQVRDIGIDFYSREIEYENFRS